MIKKGDFIEIDFIGKIKDSGAIFDLTKKDVAEKEKVANKSADYTPRIICVGNGDVVKGLDDFFVGKAVGKSYEIDLNVGEAFGRKDVKLIKMLPLSTFKKQDMKPFPGLQVNIDGTFGIIRTVSGGRVLVDFNHPIAGKEIHYDLDIRKEIKDDTVKVKSILKGLLSRDFECSVTDGVANVEMDMPEQFQKVLEEKICGLVKDIKKVNFGKPSEKKEVKKKK
ncbi:hypothetical protein HOF78_02425 [Candidatus Woesearchaeota archaeon]|jgi:FKBP-type peptidyl-prolyl cis-trans isomerase 2|nr:hypothetical protein [Candidatus Woesearchaeota archaeon]MBT6044899.1 hypothetical protein [Candidatus Woesearchaeota archaeon]